MEPAIDDKVKFYSKRLQQKLGNNLKDLILFGSRARGDFREGSDYDFIIIVSTKDKKVCDEVTDIAVEFLNKYDEINANIVYDINEWKRQQTFPLGMNVQREGIHI